MDDEVEIEPDPPTLVISGYVVTPVLKWSDGSRRLRPGPACQQQVVEPGDLGQFEIKFEEGLAMAEAKLLGETVVVEAQPTD